MTRVQRAENAVRKAWDRLNVAEAALLEAREKAPMAEERGREKRAAAEARAAADRASDGDADFLRSVVAD